MQSEHEVRNARDGGETFHTVDLGSEHGCCGLDMVSGRRVRMKGCEDVTASKLCGLCEGDLV